MLTKLALGNIRRSFRNYWAYFLSSAFSVFVLYLFLSICFGRVTGEVAAFQSTSVLFGIGAFLTACFSAFFIWYSNSFFIKSRKKEFATYMLLGMSKRQTIRLSLLENVSILVMAYAAGIAAGILLNKLLIMLLLSIMQVQAPVPFEISSMALLVSSLIFAGVIALVCMHSAWLLGRGSLIELINAAKKAERPMKVSARTWVVGVLAVGCLGLGYYLAVAYGLYIQLWILIVALVCAGTALAFLGLATLYLHLSRRDEARLYRGANLVTVSQLMHRYRGNVGALSTIAITTTVALTAVLCCCGLFGKTLDNARVMRPFSLEMNAGEEMEAAVASAGEKHPEVRVVSRTSIDYVRLQPTDNTYEPGYIVISQSNYDAVAQALGWKERAQVPDADTAMLVLPQAVRIDNRREVLSVELATDAGPVLLRVGSYSYRLFLSQDRFSRALVVADETYDRIAAAAGGEHRSLAGYMLDNDMLAQGFIADMRAVFPEGERVYTFYENYREGLGLYGVLMFVGVFVGLLFITATGSVLYFRMSMEASEDREKFQTLIKLGIGHGQLKGAVAKELAIVFGAPLALAVVNSYMASVPLGKIVNVSMTDIFIVIVAVYTLVYGLYFLLTWNKYLKTVSR